MAQGSDVYSSIADCLKKIAKYEGLRGLQSGLSSAVAYQIVMNGSRFGAYEYVNNLPALQAINGDRPVLNFAKNFGIAAVCGGLSGTLGSPFYMIKSRLQVINHAAATHPEMSIGIQYPYTGLWDALCQIFKQGGLAALYRNSIVSGSRVAVGSGMQFASYDQAKYMWQGVGLSGVYLHLASSFVSSFCVCFAMNPVDVVVGRVNNQNVNSAKYSGAFDCISQMYKTEGIGGFYKGFWPHYCRLAPHAILTFVLYEAFKGKLKGSTARDELIKQSLAAKTQQPQQKSSQ